MNLAEGYRVSQVCRVLELPRSSYYYQAQPETDQHHEFKAALQRLTAQWPRYGYRRLTAQLQREGYQVTSRACARVDGAAGINPCSRLRR